MSIQNTEQNYGSIAKWIHWIMAAGFLAAYLSVYYRQWFTEEETPENWNALQLHLSIGVTLGILVVLRIVWRVMNTQPNHEPGTKAMHLAAHYGHYILYFVMVIMPITGYIGTGVNTEYFFLFDIPKFDSTDFFQWTVVEGLNLTFKEFEEPIDFFHKKIMGEYLVWILIIGHAGAALYHHFQLRDRTLIKMTTGK